MDLPVDNLVCLTVDVEWAHADVLAHTVRLLDQHGLRATFFCTHAGIRVPGHERALHPNFRRNGDTVRGLRERAPKDFADLTDRDLYAAVVRHTQAWAPEAKGVRAHSLLYDSELVGVYREATLEYDSSYCLHLVANLQPFWKEHGLLELPIYYMDHLDLIEQRTGFCLDTLALERSGLKVFDFHPNLVFINAPTNEFYQETRSFYQDPQRLGQAQYQGRGVGRLFVDLLDHIASRGLPTATLGEVSDAWRSRS